MVSLLVFLCFLVFFFEYFLADTDGFRGFVIEHGHLAGFDVSIRAFSHSHTGFGVQVPAFGIPDAGDTFWYRGRG